MIVLLGRVFRLSSVRKEGIYTAVKWYKCVGVVFIWGWSKEKNAQEGRSLGYLNNVRVMRS